MGLWNWLTGLFVTAAAWPTPARPTTATSTQQLACRWSAGSAGSMWLEIRSAPIMTVGTHMIAFTIIPRIGEASTTDEGIRADNVPASRSTSLSLCDR